MPVNEWPLPTTFTCCPAAAASATMRTRPASVRGASIFSGWHCWLPAQFFQTSLVCVATSAILLEAVANGHIGRETLCYHRVPSQFEWRRRERQDDVPEDLGLPRDRGRTGEAGAPLRGLAPCPRSH